MSETFPQPTNPASSGAPAHPVVAIEVHYFAAACEAAGHSQEHLEIPAETTLAGLRELLAGRGLEMTRVISASSYLVNSVSTPADSLTALKEGDRVDVLPPFAGG